MLGGDDSRGPVLQNYTMSPHTNTKKGWEKGTWVVHNAEMTCQSEQVEDILGSRFQFTELAAEQVYDQAHSKEAQLKLFTIKGNN